MTENKYKDFEAKRIATDFNINIKADLDAVFALACPVEELKWIDRWKFDMIFSTSGKNENNCIFKESMSGVFVLNSPGTETYWQTTVYDEKRRQFHALLLYGNKATGKFEFEAEQDTEGYSRAFWKLTYTALNDAGNAIADGSLQERMTGMLNFLAQSAKHYLETGNMLKVD